MIVSGHCRIVLCTHVFGHIRGVRIFGTSKGCEVGTRANWYTPAHNVGFVDSAVADMVEQSHNIAVADNTLVGVHI